MVVFLLLQFIEFHFGENIVYKHSFCPNCKHKLAFKDLIPIVSYIALGGKCAYCGQKIRIRYLLLEVFSGIVFLLFALSFKANLFSISMNAIIYFVINILYIAGLFIIAGIDKESIKIEKSVLVYTIIISLCYMTYACIQNACTINTYIIYLASTVVLLLIDTFFLQKKYKQSYAIECLMLILCMTTISGRIATYFTIIATLLWISIDALIMKLKVKIKKQNKGLPMGLHLCVSNIMIIIIINFLCNWVIR